MMLNGVMYSSDQLHKMGIVDVLAPKGECVRAVHEVIRQNRRIASALLALHRVRDAVHPISHDELMRITEIWVDTALQLGDRQLRMMERLVRAQLRRPEPEEMQAEARKGVVEGKRVSVRVSRGGSLTNKKNKETELQKQNIQQHI